MDGWGGSVSTATGDSCELATARDPWLWLVDAGLADDVFEISTPKESRGSVTLDMDTEDAGYDNFLSVMDGWNWVFCLYRPRPEVLDGTWQLPDIEQV